MLRLAICHRHMLLPFFFPNQDLRQGCSFSLSTEFLSRGYYLLFFILPLPHLQSTWFTFLSYVPILQESLGKIKPHDSWGVRALNARNSVLWTTIVSFQHDTGQPPDTLPPQNRFFPLENPHHKLSKHYLRFRVLLYLLLKFSCSVERVTE